MSPWFTHPHLNPLPEGEETILLNPFHDGGERILLPPLQGEGQGGDGVKYIFGTNLAHFK